MRITKLAQGSIPPGHVEVEITIGKDGVETKVVAHGPGTSCATQNDDALLEDLMAVEVDGYGDTEISDEGHTSEYFEDKKKAKEKAQPSSPNAPFLGGPFDGGGGLKAPADERKLDLGFGV